MEENTKCNNITCYVNEYQIFQGKRDEIDEYLSTAEEEIFFSKNSTVLYYSCTNQLENPRTFLIIPSIFNSPEILFLSKKQSFISYLRDIGNIYLINWQEIDDPEYRLDDYVIEASKVQYFIAQQTCMHIDVIGHCIGGIIALASSIIQQPYINSLTLLTTPWDFTYFSNIIAAHKFLNLDNNVKALPKIPQIYIQILFFLLEPDYFSIKIDRYLNLTRNEDKEFFFKIERWLMSGHCLTNKVYFQIIDNIIENKQFKLQWVVDGTLIEPSTFNKNVYIVMAKDDHLVPKSSIISLCEGFKKPHLVEVEGGHISYLINSQIEPLVKLYKYKEGHLSTTSNW